MIVNPKISEIQIKKGLYIVGTPIGNLNDISLRAINILERSDYILCEDTRKSKILLDKFNIDSKLISYHKFNEKKISTKIIKLLKDDKLISVISDAGTPNISDPGRILINECIKNSIDIYPIPGASAVTAAVSISGFSNKFFFYGFFPEKKKILDEDLKNLSLFNSSIVFFVSSKKIKKIFPIIKKFFMDRKILICREMTKFYEEFIRSDVKKIDSLEFETKGELTVVISEKDNKKNSQSLSESDKELINKMINKLTVKEISNLINQSKNISKKEIYSYCISIKDEK